MKTNPQSTSAARFRNSFREAPLALLKSALRLQSATGERKPSLAQQWKRGAMTPGVKTPGLRFPAGLWIPTALAFFTLASSTASAAQSSPTCSEASSKRSLATRECLLAQANTSGSATKDADKDADSKSDDAGSPLEQASEPADSPPPAASIPSAAKLEDEIEDEGGDAEKEENKASPAKKNVPASATSQAKQGKGICVPHKKADEAMAKLNLNEAERQYRLAKSACPSADVLGALSLCVYAQAIALDDKNPEKPKRLREALAIVGEGLEYKRTPDQLVLRAGISGTLALLESSKSEAARLFLASHQYSSEALSMDPSHTQGKLVMGSWHKAATELNFVERSFIRMSAGPIPDSSLEESRRLLEAVAAAMQTPTAYFHLAETYKAMKKKPELAQTLKRCISAKPKNVDDLPVANWCERMLGEM